MTTIAKGNADQFSVYIDSSVTFTPGSGGYIKFGCSSPDGVTRPIDRPIYAAETIAIPAGSTVFVEAVGADGAYVNATEAVSTPFSASAIAALQAVPSIGPYADETALEAAHPAASNTGKSAYVGASAPYAIWDSNGTAWVERGQGGGVAPVVLSMPVIAVAGDSITSLCSKFGWACTVGSNVAGLVSTSTAVTFASSGAPSGAGTLTYDHAARTVTWAANGETAGAAVSTLPGGRIRVYSSGGSYLSIESTPRLQTASGTSTITVSSVAYQWSREAGGWIYVADAYLGSNVFWRRFGVAGNTTSDVAARSAEILASSPDAIVDYYGTNDLFVSGLTPAAALAARAAVWDTWLDAGIRVVAVNIAARSSGYTSTLQNYLSQYNQLMQEYAATRPGLRIADVYSAGVDASSATGAPRTGYLSDGLHYGGGYAYVTGRAVADALDGILALSGKRVRYRPAIGAGAAYHATQNTRGNLIDGSFAGTGGTLGTAVTAGTGLATNFSASRVVGSAVAGVANKITATDNGPDWQEIDVSGAAVDGERIRLACLSNPAANIAAGDTIVGSIECNVIGTGCTGVFIELVNNAGTKITNTVYSQHLLAVPQGVTGQFVLALEPITLDAAILGSGLSSLSFRITWQSATGGAFKAQMRNMVLRKVPAEYAPSV